MHKIHKMIKLLAILLIMAILVPNKFIKEIDEEYFDSNVRNFYGYYIKKEYWDLKDINFEQNNILKYSKSNFINIAHGLGARNTDKENTYEAFSISLGQGFKFFEVDIFLDPNGNLNCSHDMTEFKTICNLEDILRKVHTKKSYLIIDIKSEFSKTFNHIIQRSKMNNDPMWSSLILQIYRPNELEYYYKSKEYKRFFNPPIISTYKSNRKISDICKDLLNTGIDTIAMSLNKAKVNAGSCKKYNILIHPVQSCLEIAKFDNVNGIFTNSETKSCQI